MKRIIILWLALGAIYVTMEVIWRNGNTHPAMLVVGGLCGVGVGGINQCSVFYKMPILVQSIIGAIIVLIVEFCSGVVLNLWLGLNIWDYTGQWGNVMGQVCPLYGFFWLLLMPFAIWAEDTGRWLIWAWNRLSGKLPERGPIYPPYTLRSVYAEFFTGK